MLIWIIQSIILSVIFILILHNLICYFKDTLTIPKIKDLISSPSLKYENIYNIISSSNTSHNPIQNALNTQSGGFANNDDENINSMKNELKSFLKSQLQMNSGALPSEKEPEHLDSLPSYSSY
jgi:type III secretory pathway lipoprotein EscJ